MEDGWSNEIPFEEAHWIINKQEEQIAAYKAQGATEETNPEYKALRIKHANYLLQFSETELRILVGNDLEAAGSDSLDNLLR